MTKPSINEDRALSTAVLPEPSTTTQAQLFRCLAWVGAYHGDRRSLASWQQGVALGAAAGVPELIAAAHAGGYSATLVQRELGQLSDYLLPAILLQRDGSACVLVRRGEGGLVEIARGEGGDDLLSLTVPVDELLPLCSGYFLLIKPPFRHDERAGQHEQASSSHWFWGTLWRFKGYYRDIVLAAVMVNLLTLAGTFFTMNVYDRVVPTQAYPTLWTLAVGTLLAMSFEFASRMLRSQLIDQAGKKIDLILGAALFRQAMNVRLESRPASAGAFAHQLREFESLREFTTSATVAALSDLPFSLLFLAVIAMVGGPLAWVSTAVVALVVIAGLLVQFPLARLMRENLRQASLKHGLLIESLDGIEALKAVNGQSRMQRLWEDSSAVTALTSMKSRQLTTLTLNLVSYLQQTSSVVLIVWGVYLIHEGKLSQGALIATVLLCRQAIAPIAQAVGLAVRFQQAKSSLGTLNRLMAEKTDRESGKRYLSHLRFRGGLRAEALEFVYPQHNMVALAGVNLEIAPGEKVAVLGRIGCGKSTLLRLLSSLYQPVRGAVYADGIDLRQIDPADVHRNVGLVTQDCKLFHGSLRENILLGVPEASAEQLQRVCQIAGLEGLIRRHPEGLDMMLGENGIGLSGGQRQQVALARALLAEPPILLMDEPSSAMDAQTERQFIDQLRQLPGDRTLVIATHRMSLLELVDRIVVLEQGRVIADGPKAVVMQALQRGNQRQAAEPRLAEAGAA